MDRYEREILIHNAICWDGGKQIKFGYKKDFPFVDYDIIDKSLEEYKYKNGQPFRRDKPDGAKKIRHLTKMEREYVRGWCRAKFEYAII